MFKEGDKVMTRRYSSDIACIIIQLPHENLYKKYCLWVEETDDYFYVKENEIYLEEIYNSELMKNLRELPLSVKYQYQTKAKAFFGDVYEI